MARKSLGFTELQWTCPNCGGVNPGPEQTCVTCGAPQPDDVKFEQAPRAELLKEETKISQAQAGPDIHCAYCGTRNPAGAEVCSQCNADLSEGAQRKAGGVVGAFDFSAGLVTAIDCPHCGTENEGTALVCRQCGGSLTGTKEVDEAIAPAAAPPPARARRTSRTLPALAILGGVVICGLIAVFILLSLRTEALTGVVSGVTWERAVPVEALVPVEYQDWRDEIPSSAVVGSCEDKVRYVQAEPAPNALEVCGTPYTLDTGTGFGEVVQDCEYQIPDDYCRYTVDEWQQVDQVELAGSDLSPQWPNASLQTGQRLGEDNFERYACIFTAAGETYTYETTDMQVFQQCQVGSEWKLTVNALGGVVSIER
jgi:ribosomal protein L40E